MQKKQFQCLTSLQLMRNSSYSEYNRSTIIGWADFFRPLAGRGGVGGSSNMSTSRLVFRFGVLSSSAIFCGDGEGVAGLGESASGEECFAMGNGGVAAISGEGGITGVWEIEDCFSGDSSHGREGLSSHGRGDDSFFGIGDLERRNFV